MSLRRRRLRLRRLLARRLHEQPHLVDERVELAAEAVDLGVLLGERRLVLAPRPPHLERGKLLGVARKLLL